MPLMDLKKFKRREKVLAGLLLVVVAGIVYHNMVYKATSRKKRSLIRKLKKVEVALAEKQAELPDIKELDRTKLENMKLEHKMSRKELDTLRERLLDGDQTPSVLNKITKVAKKNKVDIVYIKSAHPVEEEGFTVLPLKISFISTYHDMLAYVKFLNSLSDFIRIEDIRMEVQKDILPNLNTSLSIHVLLNKGSGGAALERVIEKERQAYTEHIAYARKIKDPTAPSVQKRRRRSSKAADEVFEKLKLTGILRGKGKKSALINGKIYKKGEKVSGRTILKIRRRSVILVDEDRNKYILKVESSSAK